MNKSNMFSRVVFAILCTLFFTAFGTTTFPYKLIGFNAALGFASGILFCLILFSSEFILQRVSLKSMTTATFGLLIGYALGQTMILIMGGLLDFASVALAPAIMTALKSAIFLFSVYFGVHFTFRASDEVYMSIPFIRLKPSVQNKKDLVLDISILTDSRLIDLVSSGLLDSHLILPRFIMKELYEMAESPNDSNKGKARRALEVVKKMEEMSALNLRHYDADFPEVKNLQDKLVRLARVLGANLLTADMSQIEQSSIEGVRIINIHSLAKALKPLTQTGETIQIKVQRYGKEARQGIGYLDDGTMVVINGGAEYIGETIKAQVLSVKHTSSGRMIFCNAFEESMGDDQGQLYDNLDQTAKSYFAL